MILPEITTHIHINTTNLFTMVTTSVTDWLMQCAYTLMDGYSEKKTEDKKTKNRRIKIFIKWKRKITTALLKCSLIPAFREKSMAQRSHTKYVHVEQFLGFCKYDNEPSSYSSSFIITSYLASYNSCTHGSVINTWCTKSIWTVSKNLLPAYQDVITKKGDKLMLFRIING